MEPKVKERLTGALILVAAFVILVPEMLSGRRAKGPQVDAPAARPATEGPPLRSYTMDLQGAADPTSQSALTARPAEAQDAQPAVDPVVEPAPPAAPRTSAPAAEEAVTPAPAVRPAPAPKPEVAAAPAAAAASGWYVQVGSFALRANAERYAQQLTGLGFAARVSGGRTKDRELFRVRVGPVADQAAAEALKAKLAEKGHRGSVAGP